jgi:cytochrome P450
MAEAFGRGTTITWATRDQDRIMAEAMAAQQVLRHEYLEPEIAKRSAAGERSFNRDLISLLMTRYPGEIDAETFLREVTLYITASINTQSRIAPHVVAHLEAWFAANPEERHLGADRTFLQSAVAEALRLHPPVPSLLRRAIAPVEIADVSLKTGDYLVLDIKTANRDVATFGHDADLFNPHREVPGRGHGISFGGGAHLCAGRNMAVGGSKSAGPEDPLGVLVRLIVEIYAAGVRLPADEAPVLDDLSAQGDYLVYPVEFPNQLLNAG